MSNVFMSTSRSNAKIHAKTIEMETKQKEIKQQDSAANVSSIAQDIKNQINQKKLAKNMKDVVLSTNDHI